MSDTQNNPSRSAPGGPGIPARWTSSAKTGVGTALSNKSRVWFTLSHGIFNEIYYPRIDQACVRDMGLIVSGGADFFSEEKRDAGLKIHLADLPTQSLPEGKQIKFTFYWPDADHWEGNDFMVRIATWRREDSVSADRNRTNGK